MLKYIIGVVITASLANNGPTADNLIGMVLGSLNIGQMYIIL